MQFGAAVCLGRHERRDRRPGKDGGTGEVYVFEGDPTQPTFGSLLLDIANPTAQAGSQFGAAVSRPGQQRARRRPVRQHRRSRRRAVYLFNGTTGAAARRSSRTRTRRRRPASASAVAAVGRTS